MSKRTWIVLAAFLPVFLAGCVQTGERRPDWPYPEPPDRYPDEISPGIPDPRRDGELEPPATRFPSTPNEDSGPAVRALLEQAESARAAGEADQAAATLERAQRIEPRNAWVWQRLAQVRLGQDRPEQAETMAAKSNSLARGNPWLTSENWRLIAAARERLGDLAGAREARETWLRQQRALPNP